MKFTKALLSELKPYLHALVAAVVVAASYLIGVIPADGGFGDVTVVQWLGLVVFMGGAFGVTQSARRKTPPAPRDVSSMFDVTLDHLDDEV